MLKEKIGKLYDGIVETRGNNKKIVLTSKASQKYFIKLLNDDFLMSELTDQPYDSLAKDKITV